MKKKVLFTLGCSFTEGDGAYPDEPFFEPEGIPLDGSRRLEIHGGDLQNWYRNTYADHFHQHSWGAQLVRKLGYDKLINLGKCASSTSYQLKLLFDKYWDFDWENHDVLMGIYLTDSIRYSFYSGGAPSTFMCGDPERPWSLSGRYAKIIQNPDLDPLLEQLFHVKCLEGFCEARGIKLFIMNYWPREDEWFKEVHKSKHYLEQEVWNPLPFEHGGGEPQIWDGRYHSPICFHPNKEGYRLMMENIYSKLKEKHPEVLRTDGFNDNPEIIWDGDWLNCTFADEDRIEFDHEGLTAEEWESYEKHGRLPM